MTPLALVAPDRGDWQVIAALCFAVLVVAIVGGAASRLLDWLDARRAPTPLTPEQRAARGAPPFPFVDWSEVYPADAEGESMPPASQGAGR